MDEIRLLLANNAVNKVKQSFESKTAHHAYIIEGEKDTIPTALALFSAFAVCADGGCMRCADCTNALKGIHFDVKYYPAGERKKMTADDARSIVDENSYRARTVENKVILINATNCSFDISWQRILLKTLEEPNANTFLFVGTTNAGELLDTVRSRCYCVSLDKMPSADIYKYFCTNGFEQKQSQIASVMCDGNIVKAEEILRDNELLAIAPTILDMYINMKNSSLALPYIAKLANLENKYRQVFCFMQMALRETLLNTQQRQLNLFEEEIGKISQLYSPDAVMRIIPIIDSAARRVADGTNFTSVLDRLIMNILEVKYRCRL